MVQKYIYYTSIAFWPSLWRPPLWSLTMVQKIFLVSTLTMYNETNYLGGNYSREEIIQGRKLVSIKTSKGRKLFKGGNYIRADTIKGNTVPKIS